MKSVLAPFEFESSHIDFTGSSDMSPSKITMYSDSRTYSKNKLESKQKEHVYVLNERHSLFSVTHSRFSIIDAKRSTQID